MSPVIYDVDYVPHDNVLFVTGVDSIIACSNSVPRNGCVILHHDAYGATVGLDMLEASQMTIENWLPFYGPVPRVLFIIVFKWLKGRGQ